MVLSPVVCAVRLWHVYASKSHRNSPRSVENAKDDLQPIFYRFDDSRPIYGPFWAIWGSGIQNPISRAFEAQIRRLTSWIKCFAFMTTIGILLTLAAVLSKRSNAYSKNANDSILGRQSPELTNEGSSVGKKHDHIPSHAHQFAHPTAKLIKPTFIGSVNVVPAIRAGGSYPSTIRFVISPRLGGIENGIGEEVRYRIAYAG